MKLPIFLMATALTALIALTATGAPAQNEDVTITGKQFSIPRCQVVPLPGSQVSFRIDGLEKTRWHFGRDAPRPFFYPFLGPSGSPLTRMGHPGAPNHDHHRSIWFAHNRVHGIDFWGDASGETGQPLIRQTQWYAYVDGNEEAVMASALLWSDEDGKAILQQDVVAALLPLEDGEFVLELALTFRPAGNRDTVELGQTNFGFLAIRVAKSISGHFGGGTITNDRNLTGEPELFGKASRWIDYSGPVAAGQGADRRLIPMEGITCFDHPGNSEEPGAAPAPASWHVREDGWMGPSACRKGPRLVTRDHALTLRYLLHSHGGGYDEARAKNIYQQFLARPGFAISKSTEPHRQYTVRRKSTIP